LYFYSGPSTVHTVQNSIIYNSTPEAIFTAYNASVDVNYTDVEGNWPTGMGNIDADPDFESLLSTNFQLNPGSPCINAGNPDTTGINLPMFDLAGNPRISLDTIDMGANEYFAGIELNLKAFLEGPFNGTTMNTDLTNSTILPILQSYNTSPWNYTGTEAL